MTSAYGLLLAVKAVVLVLLLRVGHRRSAPRARRGHGRRAPVRLVATELVLALAALVATAVLVSVGPPG